MSDEDVIMRILQSIDGNVEKLSTKHDKMQHDVTDIKVSNANSIARIKALEDHRASDRENHKDLSRRVQTHEKVVVQKIDDIVKEYTNKINQEVNLLKKDHLDIENEIKKKMQNDPQLLRDIEDLQHKIETLNEKTTQVTYINKIAYVICAGLGALSTFIITKSPQSIMNLLR